MADPIGGFALPNFNINFGGFSLQGFMNSLTSLNTLEATGWISIILAIGVIGASIFGMVEEYNRR